MKLVQFIMDLQKAQPLEDPDGVLTRRGMQVAHAYAKTWLDGKRDLEMERQYPELAGLFYDIRADSDLARTHAIPFDA